MNSKTIRRIDKRPHNQHDDEPRAAAAEIAAVPRGVAITGKARTNDIESALADSDMIPMLTDVLAEDEVPDQNEPVRAASSSTQESKHPGTAEQWNRMALEVQKNVMTSMTRRTDELINGSLRDQLDEILDRGAERLLADIKITMQQAISKAVAEAIAAEMGKARINTNTAPGKREKNV